jgi:hypothetical protein
MGQRVMANVTTEIRMARALQSAMQKFGHECDVVAFAILSISQGTGPGSIARTDRHNMVAQCPHCGQLLTAYMNPFPKPLLFGRKAWKEVILEGGANQLHCGFALRQVQAVHMERVRRVMEA